jgi:hypothetical protein
MAEYPDTSRSLEIAIGAAHAEFNAGMQDGETWLYTASTATWIKQGTHAALGTSGASAGAGSMYVAAGQPVRIKGRLGADLSAIQDTAGGKASLTPLLKD